MRIMDQLSADHAENLRKASTVRLRAMAARVDTVDDYELANLDRAALLQVVAESIVARKRYRKRSYRETRIAEY